MRNVSAQVLAPTAMFSAAGPVRAPAIREANEAGHAVIHDAGGGHRLRLPFGDRRELRVGLDRRKPVLAAILRDHLRHVVFCVRQRGRDGHA